MYKLEIYFIGGTIFSITFDDIKDVKKIQDLVENKEKLKKYNNILRTSDELGGMNIANMNVYRITEIVKEDKQ